ncbi:hypothetical protein DSM104299_00521 [Baekduia alba]|uniref:hypothetical protein n=1 Tax=Baekduia alba TaxID=2997333 RepID=UPI0023400356|nr:hypothetical protein [Baekduia alba]WCB91843.1 hypothetical protein DSM104299_00521 [Baekduia alba]
MKQAANTVGSRAHAAYTGVVVASLLGLGAALIALGPWAHVLAKAAGVGGDDHKIATDNTDGFGDLIKLANNLTNAAMIPTIAIAPLAAVAGAFALMVGGGGRQGGGGVKLIGGAIGAVVVVAGAKGLAY